MAYFIERKDDTSSFVPVCGVEVPIRSLWGPYEKLSDAADMVSKMTAGMPRENEWQIWDIELPQTAAKAA